MHHLTKELLYTHIYWLVVKVIVLTAIFDQLMLHITTLDKRIGRNIPKVESQSE